MLVKFRINKQLKKHKIGDIVRLEVNPDGTPKDRYWYRRLKDAVTDQCIEAVKPADKAPAKKGLARKTTGRNE